MAPKVRMDLLLMKAHFFLFFSGISPIVLFMSTYAKQLGFSAILVGSIYSILPLIGILSKVLMSAFADRFQCHKRLINVYLVISVACLFSITFITPSNKTIEGEMYCTANQTAIRLCSDLDNDRCFDTRLKAEFKDNSIVNCEMECSVDDQFFESVCKTDNGGDYCDIPIENGHTINIIQRKNVSADGVFTNITRRNNKTEITKMTSSLLSTGSNITTSMPLLLLLLQFNAEILMTEISQEKSCLSIKVGGIKDNINPNNKKVPLCEVEQLFPCKMICDNPVMANLGEAVDEESTTSSKQFWMFVILLTAGSAGLGTISSVGETICFGLLGDRVEEFGKQRLWGSLGWGVMTLAVGLLIDSFSKGKTRKDYTPLFYNTLIFLLLDLIVSFSIKDSKREKSTSIVWDVCKLLKNFRMIIFVIWSILMGMSNGTIGNFLFWYLEDLTTCDGLENIKTLEGTYVMIQTFLGELPFFFLNSWVLNKLGGHINSMSFTLFTYGIIFLLFSTFKNPVYFLPISLINGITFSTMYATMTSYACIIAPPGTEATMQGLIGSVFEGLGLSFGNFLAGILMYYLKEGEQVFRLYGKFLLVCCALHILIQYVLQRTQIVPPIVIEKSTDRKSVTYSSPEEAVIRLQDEELKTTH